MPTEEFEAGPVADGFTVIVEQPSIPGGRKAVIAFKLADRRGKVLKTLPVGSVTASAVRADLSTLATATVVKGKGGRWSAQFPAMPDGVYGLVVGFKMPDGAYEDLRSEFTVGSASAALDFSSGEKLSDEAGGFVAELRGEKPSGEASAVQVSVAVAEDEVPAQLKAPRLDAFGGRDVPLHVSLAGSSNSSAGVATFSVPGLPAGEWALLVSGTVDGEPVEFHFKVTVR